MILRRALPLLLASALLAAWLAPAAKADDGASAGASVMPEVAHKKPKKKKKGYDYEKSRYKAYGALTDLEPKTYKFDENGNPVPPPGSKKTASKKKKKSKAACDDAEACSASDKPSQDDSQPPRSESSDASAAVEGD